MVKDQGLVLIGAGLPRTGRDGYRFSEQTKYLKTKDFFKRPFFYWTNDFLNKTFHKTNDRIK